MVKTEFLRSHLVKVLFFLTIEMTDTAVRIVLVFIFVIVFISIQTLRKHYDLFFCYSSCKKRHLKSCRGRVDVEVGCKSYVITGFVYNFFELPAKIRIGHFSSINSVSFILNGNTGHDRDILCSTHQWKCIVPTVSRKSNIDIGSDVWIGKDVTIMGGVKIGDGAIIASKSVVSKDVLPYQVVGGNPIRLIRNRYSDSQVHKLLDLKWWNIPQIEKYAHKFTGVNIDTQILWMERIKKTLSV